MALFIFRNFEFLLLKARHFITGRFGWAQKIGTGGVH
jgi:hypothetical protein